MPRSRTLCNSERAGKDAEACPKFEQSKRLAPAVGVTLYLADCYERTGPHRKRMARVSRWRAAGARAQRQTAQDVAAARAAALEPKLNRLAVEIVPAGEVNAGSVVQLDERSLSQDSLNVALAV